MATDALCRGGLFGDFGDRQPDPGCWQRFTAEPASSDAPPNPGRFRTLGSFTDYFQQHAAVDICDDQEERTNFRRKR